LQKFICKSDGFFLTLHPKSKSGQIWLLATTSKNAKTAPLSTAFTPLPPKHCSRTLKETVTINQRIDF
jgi:hypothetical protein